MLHTFLFNNYSIAGGYMTKQAVHEKIHEKIFIQTIEKICKELDCDLLELAEAIKNTYIQKDITDAIHLKKWGCTQNRCRACKENIPHDSHLFDTESIYIKGGQ